MGLLRHCAVAALKPEGPAALIAAFGSGYNIQEYRNAWAGWI